MNPKIIGGIHGHRRGHGLLDEVGFFLRFPHRGRYRPSPEGEADTSLCVESLGEVSGA